MPTPSGARFKLTQGSHVSPSTEAGFIADVGPTLSMQLEASPALDVRSCTYEILLPTKDAPSLSLSASGIASPPTAAITMAIPSGVYSFVLRCKTNGGEAVTTAIGKQDFSVNTFERIVSIQNKWGHRKIIVGESLEFTAPRGWTDAFNDLVEQENALPIQVDRNTGDVLVGYPDGIAGYFKISNDDGNSDALVFTPLTGDLAISGFMLVGGGFIEVPERAASAVPTPGSGSQRLFIDTADHKLKRKDSSGTVTIIG